MAGLPDQCPVLGVLVSLLEAIEPELCRGLRDEVLAYHRIQVTMGAGSFVALGKLVEETGPHSPRVASNLLGYLTSNANETYD